ncbi:VOC family protein [Amycolatopsis sp. GM8]|uniref:VOC family protein n=1 Tax=Amycolatopsis sp. GM8 TaxID=2896530 RepID=UPI001F409BEB|nr:VOC family protein [Amycolatopsis sp. GM8]
MAYDFQVTVDSANPHTLADWWADALGWDVEPSNEEFIRRMVAEGHARDEDTMTHRGVLVWRVGQAIRHPESRRRVLFQLVPEPKTVKNRVHLDVAVGENREAEVERLTGMGAKVVYRGQQGPYSWVTMTDPEGNELCLQ